MRNGNMRKEENNVNERKQIYGEKNEAEGDEREERKMKLSQRKEEYD